MYLDDIAVANCTFIPKIFSMYEANPMAYTMDNMVTNKSNIFNCWLGLNARNNMGLKEQN